MLKLKNPSLVLLSDTSEEAYGSCAYARWELDDGKHASKFISSKSRIGPVKRISIVRLELNGALMSKRLAEFTEKETRYNFQEKYYIVDSKIVRSMIQKESYRFNTFVGVRIGEIQESTKSNQCLWTKSKNNKADWITRGRHPVDLGHESKWQNGPDFFKVPVEA